MAVTKLSNSRFTSFNKYDSFLAGNSAYGPSDFDSIATTTVGAGGVSSVTFSSIPSTYSHLQIRAVGRSADTGAGGVDNLIMYFNSDTTYTNYRSHYANGNGTSVAAGTLQLSSYYAYCGDLTNSYSSNTLIPGCAIIDILDYANTNKNKTVRSLSGARGTGTGSVNTASSLWINTSAINSIVLKFPTSNVAQYSSFALYGVK